MMRLDKATAPIKEPISVVDAKNHMRVDTSADDALIASYIKAARKKCESYSGLALITQSIDMYLDTWPSGPVWLPKPPLQSITSWKYYDEDDNEATWNAANYIVSAGTPGRITVKSSATLPTVTLREADAVTIRFVCGYGDDHGDVSEMVRQAVRLLVTHFYEWRQPYLVGSIGKELDYTVKDMLSPDRHWSLAYA